MEIAEGQRDAREKLLDNFDQEVVEKVRVQTRGALSRFNERLWRLTHHLLREDADFSDGFEFRLRTNPFPDASIHPGPYRMGAVVEGENTYRIGHPLAQRLLQQAIALPTPSRAVQFDYSGGGLKLAVVEPLVGRSGWLRCARVTVNSAEPEDHVVLVGLSDDGLELEAEQCRRLFDLPGLTDPAVDVPADAAATLDRLGTAAEAGLLDASHTRGGRWFDAEVDKLERWADDRRSTLKGALDQLDDPLKEAKRAARTASTLPEKLERQRDVKRLDGRRHDAWKDYDRSWREVEQRKDELLDDLQRQMLTYVERLELFTVRFAVR